MSLNVTTHEELVLMFFFNSAIEGAKTEIASSNTKKNQIKRIETVGRFQRHRVKVEDGVYKLDSTMTRK